MRKSVVVLLKDRLKQVYVKNNKTIPRFRCRIFLPGEHEPNVHTRFLEGSKPVWVERMKIPINDLDCENVHKAFLSEMCIQEPRKMG